MRAQPPDHGHTADHGFTLLEVLVAFVIAALALGVLFGGAVEAIRATRVADRNQEALSRAQSHLASVGHGVSLRPTTQSGEDGSGYRWSLRIAPLAQAPTIARGGNGPPPALALYDVQVTVSWPDEAAPDALEEHRRAVTLRTRRVGLQPATGP